MYEELSATGKLAKQCLDDSQRWFGDTAGSSVPHHALALAGEVGEFCNIIKKVERGSLSTKDAKVRYDLAMELADIFTYLLNLAGMLNVDLEKAYAVKRAQNEKRFMEERAGREKQAVATMAATPETPKENHV